jgi:hypothetical protein
VVGQTESEKPTRQTPGETDRDIFGHKSAMLMKRAKKYRGKAGRIAFEKSALLKNIEENEP